MSFLGSVFGGVKDAVTGVGHAVGKVASSPITQGILGATLGPGAAALAGGVGRLMAPGGNLGNAAAGAVSGGAAGLTGGVLRGALAGGASGVLGAVKGAGSLLGSGGGGLGATLGLGGGAGGGGGGNGISPAVLALAGLQAANAANLGKTANDYSDKAWNLTNDSYMSRAGLRSAGIAGLQSPKAPEMGGLTAIRAQNPVAARAGVGAPPQASAPSPASLAPSPALPTPLAASDAPAIHGSPSAPMGVGRVLQHINGPAAPPVAQMAPQAPSILRSAILRGLPQAHAPMASARQGFAPQQERGHMLSLNQPFLAA